MHAEDVALEVHIGPGQAQRLADPEPRIGEDLEQLAVESDMRWIEVQKMLPSLNRASRLAPVYLTGSGNGGILTATLRGCGVARSDPG